ncbi:hypothetical protein CspeluHIS016_0400220 [Cutaneotrichosporon spelunceum]|uniref:YCII-related domain-containing protein n=1 Tax=Cutaneotrichosporon spelunceum TaxID=1672016 RepID=A0AAD3YCJ2_9TREE|nr:hypothetical protein CspeluHIS016_0400220 [Cutaneotrichosporon spelunceum]
MSRLSNPAPVTSALRGYSTAPTPPKMSLFFCYCPDRTEPDVLAKRLRVRAEHFEGYRALQAAGNAEFGRGYLPAPGDAMWAPDRLAVLPPNVQPMAGSVLMLRFPSLQEAWARVKADVYWTAGVWDHERAVVVQMIDPPAPGSVPGVEDAAAITGGMR